MSHETDARLRKAATIESYVPRDVSVESLDHGQRDAILVSAGIFSASEATWAEVARLRAARPHPAAKYALPADADPFDGL